MSPLVLVPAPALARSASAKAREVTRIFKTANGNPLKHKKPHKKTQQKPKPKNTPKNTRTKHLFKTANGNPLKHKRNHTRKHIKNRNRRTHQREHTGETHKKGHKEGFFFYPYHINIQMRAITTLLSRSFELAESFPLQYYEGRGTSLDVPHDTENCQRINIPFTHTISK